ncbi:MAG: UxaA family hydrolase, partial [Bacteroidota bacterium]
MHKNAPFLQLNPADELIVALQDLAAGTQLDIQGQTHTLTEDIPAKHKFTTRDIAVGEQVHMYGVVVGKAVVPIPAGGLISTENLHHDTTPVGSRQSRDAWSSPDTSSFAGRTFMGYHRP